MTDCQTLADEWEEYFGAVLSKNPEITPAALEFLKIVFYAGACSALALLGTSRTSPAMLRDELQEHAAGLRAGPLQ